MKNLVLITGSTGKELKTAQFHGTEHLVVPIIALVEGVLHAHGSAGPELVLAEEFSRAPQAWNGRPVVLDHPEMDGMKVSAGNPKVLEMSSFGTVFSSEIKNNKLQMEAWINIDRAAKVQGGNDVLERLRAGETVEVSVGAYVNEEKREGAHNGQKYVAIWRDIVPDHLAMLPAGTIGACSVEMGCGGPRAAQKKEDNLAVKKSFREQFAELFASFKPAQDGASDRETRSALSDLLHSMEPGFLGVDAIYPEAKKVIYACAPEDKLVQFERSYTDKDGKFAVADDKTEVKQVVKYEPVVAAAATEQGCGCSAKPPIAAEGEDTMVVSPEKKARAAALAARLAAKSKLFTLADAAMFEVADDARLTALEAQATELEKEPVVETPAPVTAPVTAAAAPEKKVMTSEEWLAAAPADIREDVEQSRALKAAKRQTLIDALKTANKDLTDEDLKDLKTPILEKMARTLSADAPEMDYSVQPRPRAATSEKIDAAPDMDTFIAAKRKSA